MPLRVIVVGGGIGGFSTAIALRRAQHQVVVLEKRAETTAAGYALEIPANASRILQHFGLDLSTLNGCRQTGLDIFKADVDPLKLLRTEERPADPTSPNVSAHRQDYTFALKDLATRKEGAGPPAEVRHNCNVTSYDPSNGSVTLASGDVLEADLVVAADGVRSKAHECIVGHECPAQLTGLSNIRFVLPTDLLLAQPSFKDLIQRGVEGRACLYVDTENNVIIHYPCRSGRLQNFGVYHRGIRGSSNAFAGRTYQDIARERVRNMNARIQSLVGLAGEKDMYLWEIMDREPLPRFYKERLVVLGDACHPMGTTMGQGAAQTVEDAAVLGIVLEQVDTRNDLDSRLQVWEELRRPRASAIQMMSRTTPEREGWIHAEEARKTASLFFPPGGLPETRGEMAAYAHRFDAVAEARSRLASKA
ncbi:hypothetical protein BDY17DRAFT_298563 [Neohortaea acidophila]|uniref:FAD-binding domain-containing protein n=1 Tax=Neohortaea acidophila TaxID=245834 RepID=A0A6A6PR52_9PEZI|nr:uncharacterized protein BDY17DRAFT_298563 [Neohortaea acidophila]KAF2482462.1 hypothetical protein BDY17DRAFT_298563 [Neohortaea acidophila]